LPLAGTGNFYLGVNMAKEQKAKVIDQVAAALGKSKVVVVMDYRGIPTKELTQLRRALGKAGGQYEVVKNTLARFAAKKAGLEALNAFLNGPVALAFGYGDIGKTVKAITEHIRSANSALKITGGVLDNKAMNRESIIAIANLPSREVLLAQLAGGLKAPIQRFHFVASAPLRGLVTVLNARAKQLESGAGAAAS
jgi:large subunit ribosomal protein L10